MPAQEVFLFFPPSRRNPDTSNCPTRVCWMARFSCAARRGNARARQKYGGRAIGSDHFVIAHVYNPKIALMPGAFPGDRKDDMRIDCRDAEVDYLKFPTREFLAQQNFHVATGPAEQDSRVMYPLRIRQK